MAWPPAFSSPRSFPAEPEGEGEAAGSEPLGTHLQKRLCARASVQFFAQVEGMHTPIPGHSCGPQERPGSQPVFASLALVNNSFSVRASWGWASLVFISFTS